MIRFVYGHDDEIREFVAKRMNLPRGLWAGSQTIGVIDGDHFLAGIVYHHWSPEAGTVVMSGSATHARWLTRKVLQRIFDFPFTEFGCQMVVMQVSARDLRFQRQLAVVGFAFTRVVRLLGRDHDGIIATLTDEDWVASPFNRGEAAKIEEAA